MSIRHDKYYYEEEYGHYGELFEKRHRGRQAHRERKPRAQPPTWRDYQNEAAELADVVGLEGGFEITYQPAKHERIWLLSSLRPFYDQHLIADVLAVVKGGKEASVYRCAATEAAGVPWLAAKVYRPRMFRNLRNDKQYRQGRETLTTSGKPVKSTDHRTMRAVGKKSAFGVQVAHTSWLMYEYTTMQKLYDAGGDVPRPVAVAENAILMDYVGSETLAAPTLNEVQLEPAEAAPLFRRVVDNVALLLDHGLVHGDLSAYNLLYWEGTLQMIDFPQVVDTARNDDAYVILERDVTRLCDYFNRYGLNADPRALTGALWREHVDTPHPMDLAADLSRFWGEADESWEGDGDDDA